MSSRRHSSRRRLRRRCRLIVASLVASLLTLPASPSRAADFRSQPFRGQSALVIEGPIQSGDGQRFAKALAEAGTVTEVLLHSPGGMVDEGYAIGQLIRSHGLATRVPDGASCVSACADIFLGGVIRRVDPGGRLGIHMDTVANDPVFVDWVTRQVLSAAAAGDTERIARLIQRVEKDSAGSAANWTAYVMRMGASPRIVERATRTAAHAMHYLDRQELLDLNVVNVEDRP